MQLAGCWTLNGLAAGYKLDDHAGSLSWSAHIIIFGSSCVAVQQTPVRIYKQLAETLAHKKQTSSQFLPPPPDVESINQDRVALETVDSLKYLGPLITDTGEGANKNRIQYM